MDNTKAQLEQVSSVCIDGINDLEKQLRTMQGQLILQNVRLGKARKGRAYPGDRTIRHNRTKKKGR